jgi:hypothetical protein
MLVSVDSRSNLDAGKYSITITGSVTNDWGVKIGYAETSFKL